MHHTIKTLASLALLLAPVVARADDPDPDMQGPPTKQPLREGATLTLSVGPGEIHIIPDADEAEAVRTEGAAFSLRVGWTLSPTATFESVIDFVNAGSQRSTLFGGSIKIYTADPLYFRVGGGLGMVTMGGGAPDPMDPDAGGDTTRLFGATAIGAVGYEWFQLRDIGLFAEFELLGNRLFTKIGDVDPDRTIINAALLLGITWY